MPEIKNESLNYEYLDFFKKSDKNKSMKNLNILTIAIILLSNIILISGNNMPEG